MSKIIILDEAGILNSNIIKNVSSHFTIHYCQNNSLLINEVHKLKTSLVLITYSKEIDFDKFYDFIFHLLSIEKISLFIFSDIEDISKIIKTYSLGIKDWINSEEFPEIIMYKLLNSCPIKKEKDVFERENEKALQIKDFGCLTIDRDRYEISIDNEIKALPRKEFEMLWLLVSEPGRVFRREEIKNYVWGADVDVNDRTIDVHIRMLRVKIEKPFVVTVKGVGYKFIS